MVSVKFSDGSQIDVSKGTKLSEVLKTVGLLYDLPCGGMGRCGQCKVDIVLGSEWQEEKLQEVLACRYSLEQDIWVKVPFREETGAVILTTGANSNETINPGDSGAKEQQEAALTGQGWGLAVDIGTTSVVGYLVDLKSGEAVSVGAELNRQRVYGADVISRITAAQNSADTLQDLQRLIIETINCIIESVSKQAGISSDEIHFATFAGNTCMHHLFLGLNPKSLGRAPFLPVIQDEVTVSAKQLGLGINPDALVWVFPVIAGFVGGDTVAAVLATNLHRRLGVNLLVDIGTNGELVLKADGRMRACSAAAGPALEGAQVAMGMRAATGAISRVRLLPEINIEVIGNTSPQGICGSGLIDLLGELVKAKAINLKGGFIKPEKYSGPEYLRERIVPVDKGCKFVLIKPEDNNGQEISISQDDLLQLQLAKGAINAAIELLLQNAGVKGEEVEQILLAGAFGNFLDQDQALEIGLFPSWARGKILPVGNAAGVGAKIGLLSQEMRDEAVKISREIGFLELAGTKQFQDAFINGILFRNAK